MLNGDGSAAAAGAWTGSIVKSARAGVIAARIPKDIRTARIDFLRVFNGVCRIMARTGCEKMKGLEPGGVYKDSERDAKGLRD